MPQADLQYSADIEIDAPLLLRELEAVIAAHDAAAGECKGRALPVAVTHRRHVFLQIALLEKPHRDAAFMSALQTKLFEALVAAVPSPAVVSIELRFQSPFNESREI